MSIDWQVFSPGPALAGGLMIGAAAAWFVWVNGRIAGISGMLGGLLERQPDTWLRLAFLAGLLAAPWVYGLVTGSTLAPTFGASMLRLVIAGLLVGVGTRFASGCTSGHGVCGLARRSPRSLAATLAFMGAGFATVYLFNHLLQAMP